MVVRRLLDLSVRRPSSTPIHTLNFFQNCTEPHAAEEPGFRASTSISTRPALPARAYVSLLALSPLQLSRTHALRFARGHTFSYIKEISSMKFHSPALLLFLAPSAVVDAVPSVDGPASSSFSPSRISFDALMSSSTNFSGKNIDEQLTESLSKLGIISIKDIPGYSNLRKSTLASLAKCADVAGSAKTHKFSDGTVRTTFATRTIPGPGGAQVIPGIQEHEEECHEFEEASSRLRSVIDKATQAFSDKLASILFDYDGGDSNETFLKTKAGYNFRTFADVVENGEHLEHFHSYYRAEDNDTSVTSSNTIDFHTDQGLFIAFTPAMGTTEVGSFYISLEDGSYSNVSFNDDDLIIMLGDGVNQFVNPRLEKLGRKLRLRATPHAMDMSVNDAARTWHGRMVLPPTDAVHEESGETFGDLRRRMIDASLSTEGKDDNFLAIGCSGSAVARQVEEVTCAEGSTYCWHRCMEHTAFDVSTDGCSALDLQLQCINPRDQFSDGNEHGDFFLACSDTVEVATDYPTIPGYPRDPEICDIASWNKFSGTTGYDFSFDRLGDNQGRRGYHEGMVNGEKGFGKVAKFMWSVKDDKIDGKLVFNGGFGYLATGFPFPGGDKNGMHGASVIMAIPGGDYSAKFGLNLTLDENVQEYTIDLSGAAFRHWSDPLPNRNTSSYKVTTQGDCFTALSFTTDNINDIKFNLDGTNDMIWAGNLKDSFCGAHGLGQDGSGDRDRFTVEWKTGKAWFPAPPSLEPESIVTKPKAPTGDKAIETSSGYLAGTSFFMYVAWTLAVLVLSW